MTEEELVIHIDAVIKGLKEHFIEEGCRGNWTFGCMSCLGLRVVEELEEMKEFLVD